MKKGGKQKGLFRFCFAICRKYGKVLCISVDFCYNEGKEGRERLRIDQCDSPRGRISGSGGS